MKFQKYGPSARQMLIFLGNYHITSPEDQRLLELKIEFAEKSKIAPAAVRKDRYEVTVPLSRAQCTPLAPREGIISRSEMTTLSPAASLQLDLVTVVRHLRLEPQFRLELVVQDFARPIFAVRQKQPRLPLL